MSALSFRWSVIFRSAPLSRLQQVEMQKSVFGYDQLDEDARLPPGQTMAAFVAILLHRLPFFNDAQRRLILREAYDALVAAGDSISKNLSGKKDQKLHQLVIMDGRYVTWTNSRHAGFLDLATGDVVKELGRPSLESVSYNLTELARRENARCAAAN